MSLEGKVGLVTGAASGIGRAIALAYARAGAAVLASDVDTAGGEATAALVREAGGRALFLAADVASAQDCEALVARCLDEFGRLDAACNNAGIGGELAPLADYPLAAWDKVIGVNLSGVFYGMRAQIPALLRNDAGGAIVNVASILGQVGFAGAPAYVAAKHGVVGLTKVAALDYAARGLRVNAVGPAFIRTPMIEPLLQDEATRALLTAQHPVGRIGRPEEVAELVLWLSTPAASFVNGSYYAVDGGYLAR
jgi:NAD(P)-dependent dehydrogenase (short-subunit alcohol dehydrogenase family)